jgi:hypothetical protein
LKPYAGFISNADFDIVVENDSNEFIKLIMVKTKLQKCYYTCNALYDYLGIDIPK